MVSSTARRLPKERLAEIKGREAAYNQKQAVLRALGRKNSVDAMPRIGNKSPIDGKGFKGLDYRNPFQWDKQTVMSNPGHEIKVKWLPARIVAYAAIVPFKLIWTPFSWTGKFISRFIAKWQSRLRGVERTGDSKNRPIRDLAAKASDPKFKAATTPEEWAAATDQHNRDLEAMANHKAATRLKKNPNDPTAIISRKN